MIRKGVILFQIQHFQQRAGRIAVIAALLQLIDLIQDHDRVARASLLHAFKNIARHRADIGAAVSADLCFIMDAAQAHIFAPQRLSDALA